MFGRCDLTRRILRRARLTWPTTFVSRSALPVPPIASGELLLDLAAVMRDGGWAWYVFGAQAVVAHASHS